MDIKLNTIEEAIDELKAGKVIIVVDDEDRENEEADLLKSHGENLQAEVI